MRVAPTARFSLSVITASALMSLAALPLRSTSARELLYIEAEQSKDIHIVDAHTLEKIGRIEIGQPTDDIVGSPDGRFAFGNAMIPSGNPIGYPDAGKILWTVAIPGMPQHLTASRPAQHDLPTVPHVIRDGRLILLAGAAG